MQLFYIFDPLCGWCYAFSHELEAFMKRPHNNQKIHTLAGGLVLGDRVGTFDVSYPQIHQSVPHLEQHTGHLFGDDFKHLVLKNTERYTLDSEPPSRAFIVFRDLDYDRHVEAASAIQRAFYWSGKDLQREETYLEICREMGLDEDKFLERFHSDLYKGNIVQEFALTRKMGITAYPALIAQKGEQAFVIARGYRTANQIEDALEQVEKEG